MKKILISPLHFLLNSDYGSELGWAYNFFLVLINKKTNFLFNFFV